MDVETAQVYGKFALIILFVLLGFFSEHNNRDGDGFYFCALMLGIWFIQ